MRPPTYIYGQYEFVLDPGGVVKVLGPKLSPVEFYPGVVWTYNDLVCWAQGFLAGKEKGGWGDLV